MIREIRLGEIHPVKAGRSAVEPAETIAPPFDLEERLYFSVDKKLVAEDAVTIRQIESQQAIVRIEILVVEHHRNVELRETRQTEAGSFIASIELIEQQVETGETFVGVLGREVDAMIVVPERAHRLVDVAVGWVTRGKTGEDIRIMLVVPLVLTEEVAREAIAFGGGMTIG